MIHQLKLQEKHFEDKVMGRKPWELRVNDRGFAIGDYIGENEIDEKGKETGRFVVEKIIGVTYPEDVPGGIKDGYVILTTEPCLIESQSDIGNEAITGAALSVGMRCREPDRVYPVYGGEW